MYHGFDINPFVPKFDSAEIEHYNGVPRKEATYCSILWVATDDVFERDTPEVEGFDDISGDMSGWVNVEGIGFQAMLELDGFQPWKCRVPSPKEEWKIVEVDDKASYSVGETLPH